MISLSCHARRARTNPGLRRQCPGRASHPSRPPTMAAARNRLRPGGNGAPLVPRRHRRRRPGARCPNLAGNRLPIPTRRHRRDRRPRPDLHEVSSSTGVHPVGTRRTRRHLDRRDPLPGALRKPDTTCGTSGKHRHGGNIQVLTDPTGWSGSPTSNPVSFTTSPLLDSAGVLGALYEAATGGMLTLADKVTPVPGSVSTRRPRAATSMPALDAATHFCPRCAPGGTCECPC